MNKLEMGADLNIIRVTTTDGLNAHFTEQPNMLVQSQHEIKKGQFLRTCIILSVCFRYSSIHLYVK